MEDEQHQHEMVDDSMHHISGVGEDASLVHIPEDREVMLEEDDLLEQAEEDEAAHKILGLQTNAGEEDIYGDQGGDVEMGSESQDLVAGGDGKGDQERSVYVGNVDYAVTVEELRDHFAACGTISRVTIMVNKNTGSPMGYGFIEFQKPEGANNALMLDETELKDRILKVALKRKNIPGMGRMANRGGRGGGMMGQAGAGMPDMQAMMMNPMMLGMMAMMNQSGMFPRGRGRGARGRGRGRGGTPAPGPSSDMKRNMKR